MQPVPLHMKLRCTGMEILIFINLCSNTQRTPANKLYNKTIIQELEAFYFTGAHACHPHGWSPPLFSVYPKEDRCAMTFVRPK